MTTTPPTAMGTRERLYALLPAIYRLRDSEQGESLSSGQTNKAASGQPGTAGVGLNSSSLRALLRVLEEQVDAVEGDIDQLYANLFIETCEDWVVPYLGELVGYRPATPWTGPEAADTPSSRARLRALAPRREVANTVQARRRKGTLALLEELAGDAAGWPARAVELRRLVARTQALRHPRPERPGGAVDLRRADDLERAGGPFDGLAHSVDVRRVGAERRHRRGLANLPDVALWVFRQHAAAITAAPACCLEEVGPHCFTFSTLGNDVPLCVSPREEAAEWTLAGELELPIPIRRRLLASAEGLAALYGPDRSLAVWVGERGAKGQAGQRQLLPAANLRVADLADWTYQAPKGLVLIDPRRGRLSFPPRSAPRFGVWVSYHHAATADFGGGEYERPLGQPADATLFQVGENLELKTLAAALERWRASEATAAVIEIVDSAVYTENLALDLAAGEYLQIRAASGRRPVLRLLDWYTPRPDSLCIDGKGARVKLDGLLIAGRGLIARGELDLELRHCTLVPGWSLQGDCSPRRPSEPSLELIDLRGRVAIEHSIVGAIQVALDAVAEEPVPIRIADSVIDATGRELDAIAAPGGQSAHAALRLERCTVFGRVSAHRLDLGENCVFDGLVQIARRQVGCVRFSYVVPGSRTPRRFRCQPDTAEEAAAAALAAAAADPAFDPGLEPLEEEGRARHLARQRVKPLFRSRRYGEVHYARLADACPAEIQRGADDQAAMGVFHDLYEPQRLDNLATRLREFCPADASAGILFGD